MKIKTAIILTGLLLAGALTVPAAVYRTRRPPETHIIKLQAHRYGYSPERIVVNQGDTIVFQPTSLDVTHGFLLDGYNLAFIIKQQGVTLLKYFWQDDDGRTQSDWDKVAEVKLTADKPGRFVYRCTQTCGNLHPFMTGELIVRPNTQYAGLVSLSFWLTLCAFIWYGRPPRADAAQQVARRRIDLFKTFPWLRRLALWRGLHFWLLLPSLVVFYLFILSALWGSPVGNRNIAIIFVWIFWWFALKAVFVPLGARLWCLVCPLPAPAEWLGRKALTAVRYIEKPFKGLHHRYLGRQRDWPKGLRNMWLQNFIFMGMISFGIILITRPLATASLFLLILGATLILMLFFRRRVFCQYLCPVGGFLGNYAMASMTEVRAIDPDVCRRHQTKSCLAGSSRGWGCPWNQYMGTMQRNNHCGFCLECVKSCPKDNISVFLRPFGGTRRLKGYDEMANVMIMLAVAIAFSVTMLGPWSGIKDAANVTESRHLGAFLTYVAVLWSSALVLVPGLFMAAVRLGNRLAGSPASDRDVTLSLAYMLIPVGIFAWIAFSLPSVLINHNYLLVVLSDPFGFGWNLFGGADSAFSPFYPQWIPLIQGILLLAGLFLGLRAGFQGLNGWIENARQRVGLMVLPAVFVLAAVNVFLRLYAG